MSRTIMLIPTGTSVGLTSVSLGVIRAMERKGVRLSVFKPIAQPRAGGDAPDQTTTIVRKNSNLPAAEPLKMSHVESALQQPERRADGRDHCQLPRKRAGRGSGAG